MNFPHIQELIPHRPPMRLVDEVTHVSGNRIGVRSVIRADSIFLDDSGHVDVLLAVEYVAQAVSAYVGLQQANEGRTPSIGFLVSCNEANFFADALELGDELEITAEHVWGETAFGKFRGEVKRGGSLIATMDLSVVGESAFGGAP